MIAIVRQMIAVDGSVTGALDKMLNRGAARPGWGWGSRGSARSDWGRPRSDVLAEVRAQPPSSPEGGP
jgi:hypothetical protein